MTVPVDIAVLESFVGPERDVVDEVLQDFLESATRMGRDLVETSAKPDVLGAAAVAHKLKSSASSVGALKLAELCALIESAGSSGDLATCTAFMPQFEAELTAVCRYLRAARRLST